MAILSLNTTGHQKLGQRSNTEAHLAPTGINVLLHSPLKYLVLKRVFSKLVFINVSVNHQVA